MRNLKFRYRIIIIFLLIELLVSTVSGVAFYFMSARSVKENFSQNAEDAIQQIENTLETRLETINQRAFYMLTNNTFVSVLQQYLTNPTTANTVRTQGIAGDYLKEFQRGEALISSACFYTERGMLENYIHFRRRDFDFYASPYYRVYESAGEDGAWVPSVQWLPPMEDQIYQTGKTVLPCVRRFTVPDHSGWEYFIYQLDLEELRGLIEGRRPFFEDIVIVDQNGRRVLGKLELTDGEWVLLAENAGGELSLDGETWLAKGCSISATGWQVYGFKLQDELLDSLRALRMNILKLAALILLIGAVLIFVLSGHMTEALSRLEARMRHVQQGDLSVRFVYPYRDEIGSLASSFNHMIGEIERVLAERDGSIEALREEKERVEEIQKQKRKAELKALQAQINPHFLYNTLNMITWQAADKGLDDVSLMASSLGKFFRLSLSRGAEMISLGDEAEHVRSYLNIQSIRYQDKLRWNIEVPEQLTAARTLKLVLQPLVENAIYHGIKEKQGEGNIGIRAWTAEEAGSGRMLLYLSVRDDGLGIAPEKLERINRALREGSYSEGDGYGIYNVNERVMLCFGKAYGLFYESAEGCYTEATLVFPLMFGEE